MGLRFTVVTDGIPDSSDDWDTERRLEVPKDAKLPERKSYQFFQEFAVLDDYENRECLGILPVEAITFIAGYATVAEGTFRWSHTVLLQDLTEEEQEQQPDCNVKIVTEVFTGLGWEPKAFYGRIEHASEEE